MDIDLPTALLGGLSPARFMRRHWHKRPLVVRAALPGGLALERAALFALAGTEGVESRLVVREPGGRWRLRHGPLPRRALPARSRPGWTLLVQGVDLHVQAAHELLARFRFVPDARLDDLMVSWASDGGGVGPHVDAYDVFLLQLHGRRRWRVARPRAGRPLRDDVPLKMLAGFEADEEWRLEAGDLLYLPPLWAHDGVAEGECMTASVGFRAPRRDPLAREVLHALLEAGEGAAAGPVYADAAQPATTAPGRIPPELQRFAARGVERLLSEPRALRQALGEVLTEPKPGVVFERRAARLRAGALRLDRRSRMMYDDRHVHLNGESYRAAGTDARLLRRLADERRWSAAEVARLSGEARMQVAQWVGAGWLEPDEENGP